MRFEKAYGIGVDPTIREIDQLVDWVSRHHPNAEVWWNINNNIIRVSEVV